VEKIFLSAIIANEPETFIALNPLNRTARHRRLLPSRNRSCATWRPEIGRHHYTTPLQISVPSIAGG
jgi:hypothetical protein